MNAGNTYVFADEEEKAIFGVSPESQDDFRSATGLESASVQNDVAIALELHRVRGLLREIAVVVDGDGEGGNF